MPKNKAEISFSSPDARTVTTYDTQGLGYNSFEKFLELEVPNDQLWVIRKGVNWLLRLLDSSGNDLPDSSRVIIGKEGNNIVDRKMGQGATNIYTNWSNLDFEQQQQDKYDDDTVLEMTAKLLKFKARQRVCLYVASPTALDVSQTNCDTHILAEVIRTR